MQDFESKLKKLGPYVKFLQEKMALRDWTFSLELDLSDDDEAYAHIICPDGRKCGTISLTSLFFEQDEEGQRHTIVHELTHCHLAAVATTSASVRDLVGDLAYAPYEKCVDNAIEYAVDGIADGWAKCLPTYSEWNTSKA